MQNYECLFYFHAEDCELVELKITGLGPDIPLSKVYHWIFLNTLSDEVMKLTFKSMNKSAERQLRSFSEGHLAFNTVEAELTMKKNAFQFEVRDPKVLSEKAKTLIEKFLSQLA